MTAKIVEVLAKILEGLSNNSSMEEINSKLMKNKHFDKKTLGIAFSLIYDKILTRKAVEINKENINNKSIRLLSELEKEILGIENYNYIMHLLNVGLLDVENMELILDQITMFPENKVSKREINWIILLSLVEHESGILPGSRLTLYSSDTVN